VADRAAASKQTKPILITLSNALGRPFGRRGLTLLWGSGPFDWSMWREEGFAELFERDWCGNQL
jgi:hypothetical protein